MRVLMFGWEFPPYISGGLGTACFGITSGLVRQGAEVVFVVPRIKGAAGESHVRLLSASDVPLAGHDAESISFLDKLEIRFLDASLKPYANGRKEEVIPLESLVSIPGGGRIVAGIMELTGDYGGDLLGEVVRYGYAAEVLAGREAFDVIHGHDWMTVFAGIRAKRRSGRPYIYHVHALEFDRSGESVNRDIYNIERYGMENADHIIAVSRYTKKMIVRHYGIPEEKVSVVHNGIHAREAAQPLPFCRRPGEKIVLFLGRITFQKGPDYFIEAASLVRSAIHGVTFVMAGSGDMMSRMVERVAELRMGIHFLFTGFLRGENVEQIYSMSDLYVMPSVSEPFGISPLEAMRCDVPVIISRQSGVSEVLRHALKVDFWDIRDLADKIIAVLRYPVLARELVEGSRVEITSLGWDKAGEKIRSVYDMVRPS
jgi:glycogen(starch) synthase